MFTKPKYGWTDLTLDQKNFFPASYLTDVPMDCLDGFIQAIQTGSADVEFDAEGWEFILKIRKDQVSVITIKDTEEKYLGNKSMREYGEELYKDISESLQKWLEWECCFEFLSKEEVQKREDELKNKLKTLRGLLK